MKDINIENNNANNGVIVASNPGIINNIQGLSPEQASQVAINLFLDIFPKLEQQAREIVTERVGEFLNELFTKLSENNFKNYTAFADPDIQYVLLEAEKEYARKGTDELRNMLGNVLVRRIESNDDLLNITLNEAIKTIPLLSQSQLNALSLLFLIKRVRIYPIDMQYLFHIIETEFVPLALECKMRHLDIEHLLYCRCGQEGGGKKFAITLSETYPELFKLKDMDNGPIKHLNNYDYSRTIIIDDDDNELPINEYFQKHIPSSNIVFEIYDSIILGFQLSSVGIVIGAINAEVKLSRKFDLTKWISSN